MNEDFLKKFSQILSSSKRGFLKEFFLKDYPGYKPLFFSRILLYHSTSDKHGFFKGIIF